MRSTLLVGLILSLTAATAGAQEQPLLQPEPQVQPESQAPACPCCTDYCRCQPCPQIWTVSADAVTMQRSKASSQVLLRSNATTLVSADDFQAGFELGPRMSITRRTKYGVDMEFNFFQLDGWEAAIQDSTAAARSAVFGTSTYAVSSGTPWEGRYTSEYLNAEANLRFPIFEEDVFQELSFLIGFRYAELNETFSETLLSTSTNIWKTDSENRMYGLQIGADGLLMHQLGPVRIGGMAKAGIFYNRSKARNYYISVGDESLADEDAAFLGETGVNLLWPVSEHLTVRAGYECMWIQSVALAPEQIPSSAMARGTGTVSDDGHVFAHGAFLGLDLSF